MELHGPQHAAWSQCFERKHDNLRAATAWSLEQEQRLETAPAVQPTVAYPNSLTGREIEVLRLVAQELTDRQIAKQSVTSPPAVHAHLPTI